jgi:hypothetical protein
MKPMIVPIAYWRKHNSDHFVSNTGEAEVVRLADGESPPPRGLGDGWFCLVPGYRRRRALWGRKGPFASMEKAMAEAERGNGPFVKKRARSGPKETR